MFLLVSISLPPTCPSLLSTLCWKTTTMEKGPLVWISNNKTQRYIMPPKYNKTNIEKILQAQKSDWNSQCTNVYGKKRWRRCRPQHRFRAGRGLDRGCWPSWRPEWVLIVPRPSFSFQSGAVALIRGRSAHCFCNTPEDPSFPLSISCPSAPCSSLLQTCWSSFLFTLPGLAVPQTEGQSI